MPLDRNSEVVKKAIHRANHRKTLREPVVGRRAEISELMRPLRDDWEQAVEGKPRGVRSYDGTSALALDQAGATIYSMMTASDNIWAPLDYEEEWRKQDEDNVNWIKFVSRHVFNTLDPSRDNFYNDAPEVVLDGIGLGDGVYYSSRPPGSSSYISKAIPWREACFDIGNFGECTHFDRWYSEPLWNIKELFGEDALPEDVRRTLATSPNEKFEVLHTVVPKDGSYPISHVHRFASLYILRRTGDPLELGGYRDMPYYVCRWGVSSGETYGLGRGIFALPDTQVLNEMSRTGLTAAQRLAEPSWAVHEDMANHLSLDPNYMNYGALDDTGQVLAKPLQSGGNLGITLEMQNQRREQIKNIFYHAMLSLVGSPTPSVVEVLKHDERRDQSMGPNIARIISEFFAPFILGRYREEVRAGNIPPPPPNAQGAKLKVRFVSPLAKAQAASAAAATMNSVRATTEIAQLDPSARFAINGLRASKRVMDGLAAPEDIANSEEEIAALMQKENEAAQAAQGLEVAERGGRAAESLARADAAQGAQQ